MDDLAGGLGVGGLDANMITGLSSGGKRDPARPACRAESGRSTRAGDGTRGCKWYRVRVVNTSPSLDAPPGVEPRPTGTGDLPGDAYRQRIARNLAATMGCQTAYDRVSNYRIAVFVATLACIFTGVYWPHETVAGAVFLAAGMAGVGLFVWLLFKHADIHRRQERAEGLRQVNLQSVARLERDWVKLPPVPVPAFVVKDPVALDLDLFGQGSLFHLICTAGTAQGRRALAAMLVPPAGAARATAAETRARQEAVAELATALDLRQEMQLGGQEFAAGKTAAGQTIPDEDPFLVWAMGEPYLRKRPGLVAATRVLPVLIVLATLGLFEVDPAFVFPLGLLWTMRYFLVARTAKPVQRSLNAVCARERHLRGYGHLFDLLAHWQPRAPELRRLATRLQGAGAAMHSLDALVTLAAIRTTPASPFAQWFFCWDYHTLWLMERWQERHGAQVSGWFEALGEMEALASLAALRFDHPTWPQAVFVDEPVIAARALGHPLLPEASRVANDVTLGPPGTFLLVTGSNMSGKSTLLRTVGMNVVLAQAGGPVCAEELRLPAAGIVLATSLRAQDSLQEGVSFFMAELRRLAEVVRTADALPDEPDQPVVLYLLDEILRGTNTEERQIIVGRVVTHLLGQRAIGAISTHDLSLAEVKTLTAAAQTVHFREEFEEGAGGATMRFDYRMRPGLATTTNALKLLKVIGLDL